jgi:hypothetical protein
MIASMVIDLSIVGFLTILPSVVRDSKNISPDIYAKIALVQSQRTSAPLHFEAQSAAEGLARPRLSLYSRAQTRRGHTIFSAV